MWACISIKRFGTHKIEELNNLNCAWECPRFFHPNLQKYDILCCPVFLVDEFGLMFYYFRIVLPIHKSVGHDNMLLQVSSTDQEFYSTWSLQQLAWNVSNHQFNCCVIYFLLPFDFLWLFRASLWNQVNGLHWLCHAHQRIYIHFRWIFCWLEDKGIWMLISSTPFSIPLRTASMQEHFSTREQW